MVLDEFHMSLEGGINAKFLNLDEGQVGIKSQGYRVGFHGVGTGAQVGGRKQKS